MSDTMSTAAKANAEELSAELNVDFENFSVPKERGEELRSAIQQVKEANIVNSIRNLIQELGVEEVSSQDDQVAGLIKAKNPKVFRYVLGSTEEDRRVFEAFHYDQELRCTLSGTAVLEASFLPKDKDFILFYVAPDFLANWASFSEEMSEVLKEAEKIKSDRQKHFKKFAKKEPRDA
jgi:hypothetical protein